MGLIRLSRRIVAPVKNVARAMTRQHSFVAGRIAPRSVGTPPTPPDGSALAAGASDLEIDDDSGAWFPEDCQPSETCSTYEGVEEKIQGIYPPLFPNPVSVSTQAIQIGRDNLSRREFILQNVGTATIYVGFGFPPTSTNYTFALNACASANDGTGGILIDKAWSGPLYVLASSSSGGAVNFTEIWQ